MAEPPSIIVLGCLTIDWDSYRTNERHREIADRVLAALGMDYRDVVEIRISEGRTEIDWLYRPDCTIRTTTHEATR